MILKNVVFLLVMLKICLAFGQKLEARKSIMIDVGHGGTDSGAVGIYGILEKDVVLDIALEIMRLNKTIFDERYELYLTRYRDTFVRLTDRGRLTKVLNADLFVSLHCNAASSNAKGMEVYVYYFQKPYLLESIALGLSIVNESTKKLGFYNRGIKFANFQVLRETAAFCPAVLVEMGFLTQNDESGYFLNAENIKAMALAVLFGIYNYFDK